jgi:hypothetical protein
MLTPDEARLLSMAMDAASAPGHLGQSFSRTLNRWANFVAVVERGYGDSIYEYTNDLSVRDVLAQVERELPPDVASKISAAVAIWDERFMKATNVAKRPLAIRAEGPGPWWNRVPKVLSEELENDLRSDGFI